MLEAVVLGISGVLWPVPFPRGPRQAAGQRSEQASLPEPLLQGLRNLAARYRLAFLEAGDPDSLEAMARKVGLCTLAERRLWTGSLGGQARPPSALPFRWLAERMELRPTECLYVAGDPDLYRGARRARWLAIPAPQAGTVDLDDLAERIEAPGYLAALE